MSQIVKYTAADGAEMELTPAVVVGQLVSPKDRQQLSDRQVAMVMATCASLRMNPLAGDCHIGVFKGRATVMPSIGYYERVAAQQQGYDGMESGVMCRMPDGSVELLCGSYVPEGAALAGGWAKAYDRGRSHPVEVRVALAEYDQHNSMWESKPATMIRKVAKAQALRELYPGNFSGTYTTDEMPDPEPVAAPVVEPEIPDFGTGNSSDETEATVEG